MEFMENTSESDGKPASVKMRDALHNVKSYIRLPLLYQHWYVAGLSNEFSRKMVAKTILNRSIVFFRRENGELTALQNRCAHRSFPLSDGHLEGDTIKCGYHGIRYAADGHILSVPCQKEIPNAGIKAYHVCETGPFAWIWMGEGNGDRSKIPDMTPYMTPGWACIAGTLPMNGNYLLMQENLADLSHLPFLHETTFHIPEIVAAQPIEMTVDKNASTVYFFRKTSVWREASTFFPSYFDYSDRRIESKVGGTSGHPGFFRGFRDMDLLDANSDEQSSFTHYSDHFMTPETLKTTHYYYGRARNFAVDDTDYSKAISDISKLGFMEDSVAIEHMQRLIDEDQSDLRDLMIKADRPALELRRIILTYSQKEMAMP